MYTDETIKRISEAATPDSLLPPPPGALDQGREIANAYFDTFSEEKWQWFLNRLFPEQAAAVISHRPLNERPWLVTLVDPGSRTDVENLLSAVSV